MSVVETQRSAAEEIERIEQAIADRIKFNPFLLPDTETLSSGSVLNGKRKRPLRETLIQQHEVSRLLDRYQEACSYLKTSLETKIDSIPKDEKEAHPAFQRKQDISSLQSIPGGPASTEVLERFDKQVANIKAFYERYPDEPAENFENLLKMRGAVIKDIVEHTGQIPESAKELSMAEKLVSSFSADLDIDSVFSGEEFFGRFLDLVEYHELFLNLRSIEYQVTYTAYLDIFFTFDMKSIYTPQRFSDKEYFEYIAKLDQYLTGFFKKIQVLASPEKALARIDQDFEQQFQNKSISWIQDLTSNESKNPLFCDACGKLFSTEGVFKGHLNGKQHKRNVASAAVAGSSSSLSETSNPKFKLVVLHEFRIREVAMSLSKIVSETKSNVERRQALTDRERQLEIETLEKEVLGSGEDIDFTGLAQENSDDESDDDATSNPLKLPIGWDGKPIPFWLWKLHGMGIEFICEICGNYSYMGRREFDKHFLEARHIHGLKCLGIEPGPLFKGITAIKDAQDLWAKVKKEHRLTDTRREHTIEMEDEEGNVMSEKVYLDLKKQGLI